MIQPVPNSKALILVGAVTSGKSSLSTEIGHTLKLKVINEASTGNYYRILDSINPYLHPRAIYEHCWIYKKHYLFKHLYEKSLLGVLNLGSELLLTNYTTRLKKDPKGDFINIEPVKQQNEILSDIDLLSNNLIDENNKVLILNINSLTDYAVARDMVVKQFTEL